MTQATKLYLIFLIIVSFSLGILNLCVLFCGLGNHGNVNVAIISFFVSYLINEDIIDNEPVREYDETF